MTAIATLRQNRRDAKLAEEAQLRARKLADIIRAYEMLDGCDVRAGAHHSVSYDAYVSIEQIGNYVDIDPVEIREIAAEAMEEMTSPTHKVAYWEHRDSMWAERVS
ncbi:hypothetical protein [Rhodococcoides fascians]|uniref:hypothetical protein n=1 Tax=Rhodococcoides fascians TaxID=1828 RepID=UPI00050BFB7A|nr:hypothetical protein [Rhodococcus fascians]